MNNICNSKNLAQMSSFQLLILLDHRPLKIVNQSVVHLLHFDYFLEFCGRFPVTRRFMALFYFHDHFLIRSCGFYVRYLHLWSIIVLLRLLFNRCVMLCSISSRLDQRDLEVLARSCRLKAELGNRCGLAEHIVVTFMGCFRTICVICRRDWLMIVDCRHRLLIQLMVRLGLSTHLGCCKVDWHGETGRSRHHLGKTCVRLCVSGDVEHVFGLALNDYRWLNATIA